MRTELVTLLPNLADCAMWVCTCHNKALINYISVYFSAISPLTLLTLRTSFGKPDPFKTQWKNWDQKWTACKRKCRIPCHFSAQDTRWTYQYCNKNHIYGTSNYVICWVCQRTRKMLISQWHRIFSWFSCDDSTAMLFDINKRSLNYNLWICAV